MIAALYVATGGIYFGLPDVDPWDVARDARKCPKCAQLADDALDEIAGGPGEFKKMLAKHLAKGTRQ